jgi:hypothetical protein
MGKKYLYFVPRGGLNDTFKNMIDVVNYCKKSKRTILLDTYIGGPGYNINFSDYFEIKNCGVEIIYDINLIKDIVKNTNLSVYPDNLGFNLIDIKEKGKFSWEKGPMGFYLKNLNSKIGLSSFPNEDNKKDIILYVKCGGGNGYPFLKHNLFLKDEFKTKCNEKVNLLKDYLCIHVRNTDLKCRFRLLYEQNKNLIHSYKDIYLCTDEISVLHFFKSKNLNVHCYTTFPTENCVNLHYSNVPNDIKIQDLFVDMFMATNCKQLLSNSEGGFIDMLRKCHKDKNQIMNKLT